MEEGIGSFILTDTEEAELRASPWLGPADGSHLQAQSPPSSPGLTTKASRRAFGWEPVSSRHASHHPQVPPVITGKGEQRVLKSPEPLPTGPPAHPRSNCCWKPWALLRTLCSSCSQRVVKGAPCPRGLPGSEGFLFPGRARPGYGSIRPQPFLFLFINF